jgi:glycopeptide antibiotics resistance protein
MIDWKKFFTKDFWSKKEVTYQYVHFTNALFIVYVCGWFFDYYWATMFFGLGVGLVVEIMQWLGGNHKIEDAIRDLLFWTAGGIVGYFI